MFCSHCGYPNNDEDYYCLSCGQPLAHEQPSEPPALNTRESTTDLTSNPRRPSLRIVGITVGVLVAAVLIASLTSLSQQVKPRSGGSSTVTQTASLKPDELKDYVIGSWDFTGTRGRPEEDYNGTVVICEDGTATIRLLELSLPGADGARAILGSGELMEYSWNLQDDGIILHPADDVDIFNGEDIVAKPYSDWSSDYWTHTLLVNDMYVLGSDTYKKRAGWNKHIRIDGFDIFQMREMDTLVADDDFCTIKVIGSGYDEEGTAGYLLEVTNKTDEEVDFGQDYTTSYDEWTIAGADVPNPDFSDYFIAPAKDGKPTTKHIFMSFFQSYSSLDGLVSEAGFDGDLDDLHDVVGALEITLQESFDSHSYPFKV